MNQSIIDKAQELFHKEGVNPKDWESVHPNLLVLIDHVIDHCDNFNLPLTITSIIRPKIKDVSQTDIHSTGRAFDLSVRGWSKHDIEYLVKTTNDKFHIGAISLKSGEENEVIYEDGVSAGKGAHFHFQVRK